MGTPRPARVSWVLLVVVVAALAVGAAASILVNAATTPSSSSGPVSLIYLPPWILTIASFGFLAFVGLSLVIMRLNGSTRGQSQFAVRVLMAILVGIIFLLVVHSLGLGSAPAGSSNVTSTGGGSSSHAPPTGGSHNFTGSGGVVVWPGYPAWLPFVLLAAVVFVTVLVAVPEVRRYLEDRRSSRAVTPGSAEVAEVRQALSRAAADLRGGSDPRAVILGLYAAMLARLQPMVVGLDTSTPEEIRAAHLERLGVRPGPARTLTRLFEEARYSVHPMGPESSRTAQEAVQAVLDDLDRRDFPG